MIDRRFTGFAGGARAIMGMVLTGVRSAIAAVVNLLANGTFTSDVVPWAVTQGAGSIVASAGQALVTCTSATFVVASAPFATVVGQTYRITGDISAIINSAFVGIRKSDTAATVTNLVEIGSGAGVGLTNTFVATATTTYVLLQVNSDNGSAKFDNIVAALV